MMGNTRAETTRHWAIRAATWLAVAGGYFVLAQLSFRSRISSRTRRMRSSFMFPSSVFP
jgi:hypothetical protein